MATQPVNQTKTSAWQLDAWWKKTIYVLGWIFLAQILLSLVFYLTFFSVRL